MLQKYIHDTIYDKHNLSHIIHLQDFSLLLSIPERNPRFHEFLHWDLFKDIFKLSLLLNAHTLSPALRDLKRKQTTRIYPVIGL